MMSTQEIARNVGEAAQGTGDVSMNVVGLSKAAGTAGLVAEEVLVAAQDLSGTSDDLRAVIEGFLSNVRAG